MQIIEEREWDCCMFHKGNLHSVSQSLTSTVTCTLKLPAANGVGSSSLNHNKRKTSLATKAMNFFARMYWISVKESEVRWMESVQVDWTKFMYMMERKAKKKQKRWAGLGSPHHLGTKRNVRMKPKMNYWD